MEQCFRIALWMFCLIGYLQAFPTQKPCYYDLNSLGFNLLREEVSCGLNVTLPSQTNVQVHNTVTLACFIDGLAKTNCKGGMDRISQTLEVLESKEECLSPTPANCGKWEKKPFAAFLDDFETFIQKLNSNRTN